MKTIYKYSLLIVDEQYINMPINAKILCVQIQNDIPVLYALVDTDGMIAPLKFYICGTGHPCELPARNYIGTFQILDDKLIYHVFKEDYGN